MVCPRSCFVFHHLMQCLLPVNSTKFTSLIHVLLSNALASFCSLNRHRSPVLLEIKNLWFNSFWKFGVLPHLVYCSVNFWLYHSEVIRLSVLMFLRRLEAPSGCNSHSLPSNWLLKPKCEFFCGNSGKVLWFVTRVVYGLEYVLWAECQTERLKKCFHVLCTYCVCLFIVQFLLNRADGDHRTHFRN
jgi:hypothetical protein